MICLDACVIGHVLVPQQSRVTVAERVASKALIDRIITGALKGCSPTITISEVKWFVGRIMKESGIRHMQERTDEVEDLLPQILGSSFRFIDVDFAIAALAADYRLSHYSKKVNFSYNDGIYLATASITGCNALITTDTHLLAVSDVPVFTPSAFLKKKKQKRDISSAKK